MRIALVTTCKGRASHLKQTLPRNLLDNASFKDAIFVVLDYESPDDLVPYLKEHHAEDLESGRLVIYSFKNGSGPFEMARAKNMAARCGVLEGADVLVTLDADNFTGPNFAQFVSENLEKRSFLCPDFPLIKSLPHGPDRPARGYAGRLAISSMDFLKMGGYDEFYDTWRGEDIDMNFRLQRAGFKMKHIPNSLLQAIPHGSAVRFLEYPHARRFEDQRELKIIRSRTQTVVNYGRFGLGTVRRNFSDIPIKLGPLPTRVFGIGMHKTATTSLHEALNILGLDSFHWGQGEAPKIWHEMNSLGRSNTLEQFYSLCDLPIPLLYKKLDRAYPGSKFILTIRNEARWLKSVEKLWDYKYNPTRWMWDVYPFSNHIHSVLYGTRDFKPELFLARYRRHNAEVLEYFEDRDDLLVMNMEARTHWPKLCAFLGKPVPDMPYPKWNIS